MKKKTFKRIMSGVFSTLMLASGVCVDVNATVNLPNIVEPMWDNVTAIRLDFDFDYNTVDLTINGKLGTTRIDATVEIYEKSGSRWIFIDEYTGGVNGTILSLDCPFNPTTGKTYKAVLSGTVTRNGITEDIDKETISTY